MAARTPCELGAVRRAAAPTKVLTFRLGAEEYAIELLCVQEIRSYEAPTHIVNSPAWIKGVVDLNGVIVPIFDLRLKFGLAEAPYDGNTVTIVLNIGARVVGVVVDSVADVVALTPEQARPAPELDAAADYILGLGSLGDGDDRRLLIIIDLERVLEGFLPGPGGHLSGPDEGSEAAIPVVLDGPLAALVDAFELA